MGKGREWAVSDRERVGQDQAESSVCMSDGWLGFKDGCIYVCTLTLICGCIGWGYMCVCVYGG